MEMEKEAWEYARMFALATKAKVKDCIVKENVIVVIVKSNIAFIVGYKGCHVNVLSRLWGKRIKVVEWSEDVKQFIKNFIRVPAVIRESDEYLKVYVSTKHIRQVIGRNGRNANLLRFLVKKYFPNAPKLKFIQVFDQLEGKKNAQK